ncbi:hypothetical protein DTO166G4_5491 [Paecilomyces variotii]|nr:hypothetical protein DTO032I3_5000 [Paecilomyces variotii]KAJ9212987.1 hypothetical protein DTO166G4_5491 [Paecilomyces variotii]KAJ9219028.1 hypothetical protein DTO169C6_8603 [Paecilomyces variotii]KAJ9228651.1 hypothetical protein DTO166G5_8417 [Paecilomyces variotii]KAJ9277196.1 hypothetical protein DTO021D3_5883 [Paecilomyces variotii]
MSSDNLHRTQTVSDLETGTSEAIRRHAYRHVLAAKSISQRILHFERITPDQLSCIAEATGAFFYVFPGLASITTFVLNTQKELRATAYGSFFQIFFAFTVGSFIALFVRILSLGHMYPAITIASAMWRDFPWKTVPRYILSQILGATVAGLLVVDLRASSFHFQELPGTSQRFGYLFMVEFFVDSLIGVLIWTAIEATVIVGITYGAMVWGFAPATTVKDFARYIARSVDQRIFATLFLCGGTFSYRLYFWVAILVHFPVVLFAAATWELFLRERFEKKLRTGTKKMVREDELGGRTSSEHVGFIRTVS